MRLTFAHIAALSAAVCSAPAPGAESAPTPPRRHAHLRLAWPESRPTMDAPVRRVANEPAAETEVAQLPDVPALPGPPATATGELAPGAATALEGGQSLSLQAALYGAITGNPDLVTLRNSNIASPEAVEVARLFPTTLNPTLWIDVRPWVNARNPGRGLDHKDAWYYFSWRQPVELGHQTTHRHAIARAALSQQQWNVLQAELVTLVQTYRFFQTSAYRREKLRVARELSEFNDRLVHSLRRRLEANQVKAADVVLAEVENEALRQQVDVARQDYANALTDLRNQIGRPETAGAAEPLGEFVLEKNIPEVDEQGMVQLALRSRPDIHAARAAAEGACAAVKLARADRIPTPIVGPEYQRNENGTQFFGFVYITPVPVVNNGMPLVRQREAEYRRSLVVVKEAEERATTQARAAVAKWNAANRLVRQTTGLTESLSGQVGKLERLFEENQTDLTQLLQARQRLLQLRNAELDAIWQATQAQADLLTALGAPYLIAALNAPPGHDAVTPGG